MATARIGLSATNHDDDSGQSSVESAVKRHWNNNIFKRRISTNNDAAADTPPAMPLDSFCSSEASSLSSSDSCHLHDSDDCEEKEKAMAVNSLSPLAEQQGKTAAATNTPTSLLFLRRIHTVVLPWTGALVWPLMLTVPLLLSSPYSPTSYRAIFPAEWYDDQEYEDNNNGSGNNADFESESAWPKPLGLILGITTVAIGQVFVWAFFYLFKYGYLSAEHGEPAAVQTKGATLYTFSEGVMTHISQPEGFVILIGYLGTTWMLNLLPASYYSFAGTIQYKELAMCLIIQDAIQYLMHLAEHVISPKLYRLSHKPHHRFTNPRLFDAFNGSLCDTICMICIPLFLTAQLIRTCNVWTYMAFGSSYACWLTLIHSEYTFVWDPIFRVAGLGTPADHHVHHAVFVYNYGHLFMWMDILCGTYKDSRKLSPKIFNNGGSVEEFLKQRKVQKSA